MPWQLSLSGHIAGVSAAQLLAGEQPLPGVSHGPEAIAPWLAADRRNWLLMPYGSKVQAPAGVEIARGRAAMALIFSQLNSSPRPGRIIAAVSGGVLALDITPASTGIAVSDLLADGRWDANPDFAPLISKARQLCPRPALMLLPGSGADGYLQRLMPFFGNMAGWTGSDVNWQFAEAGMNLEMAGALYSWAWMAQGLAWGQWQGDAVVVELDNSPMMGVAIVRWQGSEGQHE